VRNLAVVMQIRRFREGVPGCEVCELEDVRDEIQEGTLLWIDSDEPSDEERDSVTEQLGLEPIVVRALTNPQPERTKLLRYGEYFHVAVHDCEYTDDFHSREIDVVIGPGWIVTVRHPDGDGKPVDLEEVLHRFDLQRTAHADADEGFLLWALFDVVIDRYFDVNDVIDERLNDVEESVFNPDTPREEIPKDAFALRRHISEFRRAAAPMREVVNAVTLGEVTFVGEVVQPYFHDLYDRSLRVLDFIETQRDLLAGLLEADLAVISNRLNTVMKKVTSWGAILLGATLIAGIYGMNFEHMPELSWSFGYPLALGAMLVVMIVLYVVFKRKGWL
jgi:magnesium transporter